MKDPSLFERSLGWMLVLWTAIVAVLQGTTDRPAGSSPPAVPSDPRVEPWVGAVVLGALFAGAALLAHAWSIHRSGGLRPRLRVAGIDGLPFLETVVFFIPASLVVGISAGEIVRARQSLCPLGLQVVLLGILLWPLWRGISRTELLRGLGWHRGEGWGREIVLGVAAYLAALPILAGGLALSAWISQWAPTPYHPLVEGLRGASSADRWTVFFLALVWAPILEESVFRGALYTYLRGRLGAVVSMGASGLVFAALHPQGWASWPFLLTLAGVLAWLREWRGSILAPMTLHFLHNGIMLTLIALLMT